MIIYYKAKIPQGNNANDRQADGDRVGPRSPARGLGKPRISVQGTASDVVSASSITLQQKSSNFQVLCDKAYHVVYLAGSPATPCWITNWDAGIVEYLTTPYGVLIPNPNFNKIKNEGKKEIHCGLALWGQTRQPRGEIWEVEIPSTVQQGSLDARPTLCLKLWATQGFITEYQVFIIQDLTDFGRTWGFGKINIRTP